MTHIVVSVEQRLQFWPMYFHFWDKWWPAFGDMSFDRNFAILLYIAHIVKLALWHLQLWINHFPSVAHLDSSMRGRVIWLRFWNKTVQILHILSCLFYNHIWSWRIIFTLTTTCHQQGRVFCVNDFQFAWGGDWGVYLGLGHYRLSHWIYKSRLYPTGRHINSFCPLGI